MTPKVSLVNFTSQPEKTIFWAFMNMHNPIPNDLSKIELSDEELNAFMEMVSKQPHQTVFEYVNTVWLFEGVSRAFQQQLTRTRQASYSIQSMRIVKVENFVTEKQYSMSSGATGNPAVKSEIEQTMDYIQSSYRKLLAMGASVEDARGILPLNIHSPITMSINLRSLIHLLELRFCENTQEEFREVAKQMKQEVNDKMGPIFAGLLKPICFTIGKCPSPVYCGKYKFEREVKGDVSRWVKG